MSRRIYANDNKAKKFEVVNKTGCIVGFVTAKNTSSAVDRIIILRQESKENRTLLQGYMISGKWLYACKGIKREMI